MALVSQAIGLNGKRELLGRKTLVPREVMGPKFEVKNGLPILRKKVEFLRWTVNLLPEICSSPEQTKPHSKTCQPFSIALLPVSPDPKQSPHRQHPGERQVDPLPQGSGQVLDLVGDFILELQQEVHDCPQDPPQKRDRAKQEKGDSHAKDEVGKGNNQQIGK